MSSGLLSPIEEPLTAILEWLHGTIGLTVGLVDRRADVMVRIVMVPLTVKQIHSMQSLQAARAGDQGDPAEVQGRQAAPATRR